MRSTVWLLASCVLCLGAGCTALVEGTLSGRGGNGGLDAGMHDTGPVPDTGPMIDSGPASPCSGMPDGLHCTMAGIDEPFVCVSGVCVLSRCGDGALDARSGSMHTPEECDDGNSVAGDGCEATCMFSCHTATDCDDALSCDGIETCDQGTTHTCQPGTAEADSTPCTVDGTAAVCHSGVCRSGACGDGTLDPGEECDDSNVNDGDGCDADCTYTCVDDSACQNGNACDGNETCIVATHTCMAAAMALDCADTDPCTNDTCDATMGCLHTQPDADGDHSFAIVGACGDDCDDTNPNAYPGAPETCTDTADLNCDGMHGAPPTYYADCDRDGYARTGAQTTMSCAPPTTAPSCPTGLTGQWISVEPTTGHIDCLDTTTSSSQAHPNQTSYFPSNITSLSPAFDFNCSGSASREFSFAVSGSVPRGDTSTCSRVTIGTFTICTGDSWYVSSSAPACGSTTTLSHCGFNIFSSCTRLQDTSHVVRCH